MPPSLPETVVFMPVYAIPLLIALPFTLQSIPLWMINYLGILIISCFSQFLLKIVIKTQSFPHLVTAEHWPSLTSGWARSRGASVCDHQWSLPSTMEEEVGGWGSFCLLAASLLTLCPISLSTDCLWISWVYLAAFLFLCCFSLFLLLF